ncbi:gamma-glutamyl hydrolase [Bufo gargarizans]|uniref:gamma-glutamyl hydrolase n=1 Tax=Bufo gargarizans TaxID=30331 RepID=UPI001CF18477|nr:gamma-glutamyl hydrolase [Bufo gargarizans]
MQCRIFGCDSGRRSRGCRRLVAGCLPLPCSQYRPLTRRDWLIRCPAVIMGTAAALGLLTTLLLLTSTTWGSSIKSPPRPLNDRPVIGILSQETHFGNLLSLGHSYIAASYVKTLESAGARVIPIMINLTEEEYAKIFSAINGILLPGGGVDLRHSGYAKASKIFYDLALAANDKGDYFPIWGTCLGFEQLTVLTSGDLLLTLTKTEDISLPLNFTENVLKSKLFQNIPRPLYKALSSLPLTANFHDWSLSMQNFTANAKLRKFYNVLSTNFDGVLEFISTFEAYDYPFYGVQWHPEKNPFEWKKTSDIPHTAEAVQVAFYMADFFVNEARKSQHQFSDEAQAQYPLIYNYSPAYTGNISVFEQMYFF